MVDTQFGPDGWTPDRIDSLAGKTYLVTGATSGTGFETARILLNKGAQVVTLNRNPDKSAQTIATLKEEFGSDAKVSFVQVDLGVLASVRKAAEEVLQTVSRIDALICNAAIAQVPSRVLSVDGYESQLATNHYGHFLLQGLLFAKIEESHGRIVAVGSEGYKMGIKTIKFDDINWDQKYSGNNAYSQSKLAQIMSIYELQDRLKNAGKSSVKAYACHPGSSKTALITTSGSMMMRFMFWLMTLTPMVQAAENGAYPGVMCATEPDLDEQAFYGPTGKNYFTGPVGECELAPHAIDKAVSKKLWDVSEEAVGFSWNL